MTDYYAAVGSNGSCDVVWGVGETEADALADAECYLSGFEPRQSNVELTMYKITTSQYNTVLRGDVNWKSIKRLAIGDALDACRVAGYDVFDASNMSHPLVDIGNNVDNDFDDYFRHVSEIVETYHCVAKFEGDSIVHKNHYTTRAIRIVF